MVFLASCGYVSTTVWMHHMNLHKTHAEKASMELRQQNLMKNDVAIFFRNPSFPKDLVKNRASSFTLKKIVDLTSSNTSVAISYLLKVSPVGCGCRVQ